MIKEAIRIEDVRCREEEIWRDIKKKIRQLLRWLFDYPNLNGFINQRS